MRSAFREAADSLFSIIFPTQCSICGREVLRISDLGICRACWLSLDPWEGLVCERCGLPIPSWLPEQSELILCGQCRIAEPDFEAARAYGLYRGNLRALILQLKFHRRERLGRRLGGYLGPAWRLLKLPTDNLPPLLVPVPLFRARQKQRGFNQSESIAKGLLRELSKRPDRQAAQLETGALIRHRQTKPQTGLKPPARKENVRGVFKVVRPERVAGRVVVLIDDVMTTGATVSACAHALKRGGAKGVFALVLARSTPQFPDTLDDRTAVNVDETSRDST